MMRTFRQTTAGLGDAHTRVISMRTWLLFAALVLLVFPSCGRSDRHRVSGRVHFPDGTPLTSGRVAVDFGDGRSARGRIDRDGTFRMGTLKDRDGMRAGTWQVAILDSDVLDFATGATVRRIDPRFEDPRTSGLSFEVPKQMAWDITVEPPPAAR